MSDFDGREYGVGTVRGVRAFSVDDFGRLKGVQFPSIWTPGENVAKCSAKKIAAGWTMDLVRSPHGGPPVFKNDKTGELTTAPLMEPAHPEGHSLKNCSHGFYAFYDGSNDYKSDARISAVVEGYGETLVGSRGFRAEKARIVALCFPGAKLNEPTLEPTATATRSRFLLGWPLTARILYCIAAGTAGGAAVTEFAAGAPTHGAILAVAAAAQWAIAFLMPFYPSTRKRRVSKKQRELDALAAIRSAQFGLSATRITETLIAKIRRNYPDVKVFNSFDAMVRAFPPDKGLEPSPETDPNFWTVTA